MTAPRKKLGRREFLTKARQATVAFAVSAATPSAFASRPLRAAAPPAAKPSAEDERILALIEAHRPSRLTTLPASFNARVGATHVAGKYCLTKRPFLLEGAEKLLELGTRLGKFWLIPGSNNGSYPFHSQWGRYQNFVELAKSDYFQQLLMLPFDTVLLEAQSPVENEWRKPGRPDSFYQAVTQELYDICHSDLFSPLVIRNSSFMPMPRSKLTQSA